MEQQIINNLPKHLLDIPAFFAVKPNKVPKVNDWGNPKNQKSYKDVRGLMGFDITKADILVFDFDNALDKDGNWRNDKVKATFERIMQLNPYSEISISNKGIHIAVKPTKGKFDKITNAGANVLYFDDDHKAKDCPKLEIFYGSKARYILFTGKVFHCKPKTPIPEGELVDLLVAKILDEIHLANKNSAYLVRTEENQKGKVASTLGATYQKPKREGFMTSREVAAWLQVTEWTVRDWRKRGIFNEDIKDHKGVYWYSIERVEQLKSVYRTNDKDPADNISAAHMKHYSDNDDDNCFSELDNIKDALKYIPADLPYQDWLNVLMAAHSFDSSPSMMFIMDEWSKTAPNVYKDGEVAYKWQSFNPSDGITIATLFDYAKKYGYVYKHKSKKKYPPDFLTNNSNSTNSQSQVPSKKRNDDDIISEIIANLQRDKKGEKILASTYNFKLILNNDPFIKGCIGYDEFNQMPTRLKIFSWTKNNRVKDNWRDVDDAGIQDYIALTYGIRNQAVFNTTFLVFTHMNTFHPVREYLNNLPEWDGVERAETFFINTLGVKDSIYSRTVTNKWLLAAVVRVMHPASKFDYCLVFKGEQGIGKSTVVKNLGVDWFNDSISNIDNKDGVEGLLGRWIIELGEMQATKKADNEAIKAFISRTEDIIRLPYNKRCCDKVKL